MTAQSSTDGCLAITCSTSALYTLNPPVTIPTAGSVGRQQASIHREVAMVWGLLARDDSVRSVLVTGADDEFYCSAAISGLKAIPSLDKAATFEVVQRLQAESDQLVYGMVNLDKPVVAAINGSAAGGGLAVALLADISVADSDAVLVDPHAAFGLAAGDHAAMLWPILCGMAESKLYLLTADPLDGAQAEGIGLISRAVSKSEVLPIARQYAQRLATGPHLPIRYTKRVLNQWLRLGGIAAHDYSAALEMLNFFGPDLGDAAAQSG